MNHKYDIYGDIIWNLPIVKGRKKDGTIAIEEDWKQWKKEFWEKEKSLQERRNNIYF